MLEVVKYFDSKDKNIFAVEFEDTKIKEFDNSYMASKFFRIIHKLNKRGISPLFVKEHLDNNLKICRGCGCTDMMSCEHGCSWIEEKDNQGFSYCSACHDKYQEHKEIIETMSDLVEDFTIELIEKFDFSKPYELLLEEFVLWYIQRAPIYMQDVKIDISIAPPDTSHSYEIWFQGKLNIKFLNAISLFNEIYHLINDFWSLGISIRDNVIYL